MVPSEGEASVEGCRPSGRLWDSMLHPDAVETRATSFAFSSKGLPKYYDYRNWTATTFMIRDRAMGNFVWPWALCVVVAAAWVALVKHVEELRHPRYNLVEFERMYSLIFTALGFMLVFRLSRAAVRFWDCRAAWGTIAMRGARRASPRPFRHATCRERRPPPKTKAPLPPPATVPPALTRPSLPLRPPPRTHAGRVMVDDAIVNLGRVAPEEVDELIRWFVGFIVATKCWLRVEPVPAAQLAGVLGANEIEEMHAKAKHVHLYCANRVRSAIARALLMEETAAAHPSSRRVASLHPHHAAEVLRALRSHLDVLVDMGGAMERIKATRLPVVYVSHLRTFLLLYVLSMPFVYVGIWGWGTVPAVGAVAFALLGIEGAATECENPFSAKRTNHLGMDGFCENSMGEVMQMLRWWKEREDEAEKDEGKGGGK